MGLDDKYSRAEANRRKFVDAIIDSNAFKKIIVAGPGTGKTFLFKELLKGQKKRALTLTFVNSLVDDLALELHGLSDVRTLHGFARSILAKAAGTVQVFPLLSSVIREDIRIETGADVDFDKIFNEREDANPDIAFYKSRKDFYQHNGHTDLIFAAAKLLEKHSKRIPTFDLVLVDEFQDFNNLEVSLINLLAKKSKILIAGDDDQALYFFKYASPDHIRRRYHRQFGDYEPFTLVHCSRCTRVIVDLFNDVVSGAVKDGRLKERVAKKFVYFDDPKRESDCQKYSKVTRILAHSSQIAYAIERQLDTIASDLREPFSNLVIVPTKNQCRSIVRGLVRRGFRNVSFVDRDERAEPSLVDGMKLLLADKNCNLGWRLVAKSQLPADEFERVVKDSIAHPETRFLALLEPGRKKKISKLLSNVRRILKGREISDDDCAEALGQLGIVPLDAGKRLLREELETSEHGAGASGLRDLPIKVTTIPGSKGLSEDYVFIAHFDDRFFLDKAGKITDQNVCNLLVAITRARRKLFLISCQEGEPKFLNWVAKERVETINLRGE